MAKAGEIQKFRRNQKIGIKLWLGAFCILIASQGLQVIGQNLPLPFQNLSVQDGLPQNAITALIQDDQGFLWIGTQDGLARYDGYDFKIFRSERGDPNSLSHNFIWNITKDKNGILWITTLGNGMTRLDPEKAAFRQYLYSEEKSKGLSHWNTFSSLKKGNDLWVGTNESLDKINLHDDSRTTFFPGNDLGTDSITSLIRSMVFLPDSQEIWMSTQFGLTCMNSSTGVFAYYPKSPFGTETNLRSIFQILVEGEDLIITTSNEVIRINFKQQEEEVLFSTKNIKTEKTTRFHGFLRGVDKFDYIYSSNGLFQLDRKSGAVLHRVHDPETPSSLADNYVVAAMQSQDGVLWLGTRNGLSAIRSMDKGFKRFGKSENLENSLLGTSVNDFALINDSTLLVGSSEGVEIANLNSGKIEQLDDYSRESLPINSRYTLCLFKDENEAYWTGSRNGGLTKIEANPNGDFSIENFPLNRSSVQFIYQENDLFWLGTNGSGLLLFSEEKGILKSYPSIGDSKGPSHPFVYTFLKDSKKNYWLGTPTGGINLFDPQSEKFLHLNKIKNGSIGLSGNFVLCLFEDSNQNIWVGTTTGLSKLITPIEHNLFSKVESGNIDLEFQHFGREEGFPNEVIYGILEDEKGLFWISTNQGIVSFDPELGIVLETFTRDYGCQTAEYNQNAYLKFPDGKMAFGGVGGFQIFHPDSLESFNYKPKPVITEIEVNNEPFREPLRNYNFSYKQNDLAFRFAGLSYVNSHENTYRYRLEGFDEEWYARKSNRLVTYTNLDPGSYEFQVEAINSDGIRNDEVLTLSFSIAAPPWLSWYAYLAYFGFLALAIFSFLKWRTDNIRKVERRKLELEAARSEERELFRKRSARDFHDEAGNKITRINLLVELAKSDAHSNSKLSDYLGKIARNTSELSRGMRDFNWSLDPEKDSLFDLIDRVRIFGESMYEGEERSFKTKGMTEEFYRVKIPMDLRRDLLMIFKEAINNAVKYSESNTCELSVVKDSESIELKLYDFGKGFNLKNKSKGYGLKNMKSRAEKHGLDLKITQDDENGTCISINLPHMGDM